MDELEKTRARELVARVIAAKVEDLQRRGMKPDQIAIELRKVGNEAGVPITCEVKVLAGLRMLDVRIGQVPPGAAPHPFDVKTGPEVKAPASKCPGPHYAAPCCGAEICFHEAKELGKPLSDAEETACCPKCTSFLRRQGDTYESLKFSCLSMDDVIALSDDDRIRLQRTRLQFEQQRQGGY